jgi:putative cell wall-binding protein
VAFPSRASHRRVALVLGLTAVFAVGVLPWSHWFAAGGAPDVRRLGGTDRYATAASISADLFPGGSKVVYVASGETFPDALSASAAAGRGAPVLLTAGKRLPAATATELARLHPQLIVAVGGFGVISDAVLAAMRPYATTGIVSRYAGIDRFATAAAVSRVLFPNVSPTVFLATGLASPDATAGAPAAAGQPGPLLLVGRDAVPLATTVELSRLHPSRIVLVGGPDVISDAVAKVASQYAETVRQWGGATRIDTSVAVANRISTPGGWTVIANGWSFSDGIVGAAAASFLGGPILFTDSAMLSPTVANELTRNAPGHVLIIGGPTAVSNTVVDQVTEIMRANASTDPSPSPSAPDASASPSASASASVSDSASPSASASASAGATPTVEPVTPAPTATHLNTSPSPRYS